MIFPFPTIFSFPYMEMELSFSSISILYPPPAMLNGGKPPEIAPFFSEPAVFPRGRPLKDKVRSGVYMRIIFNRLFP